MFDEITLNHRTGGDDTGGLIAADQLVALWSERNRLNEAADEADLAHDEARLKELDLRRIAIEETMVRTPATTLPGILAQVDLLAWVRNGFEPGDDEEILLENIRAALVALIEREGHLG